MISIKLNSQITLVILGTCQMTLCNSNELATGTVKLVDDVYECEFEKRAYTDIANKQVGVY